MLHFVVAEQRDTRIRAECRLQTHDVSHDLQARVGVFRFVAVNQIAEQQQTLRASPAAQLQEAPRIAREGILIAVQVGNDHRVAGGKIDDALHDRLLEIDLLVAHDDTLHQPKPEEQRQQRGAARTDKGQRQPGYGEKL